MIMEEGNTLSVATENCDYSRTISDECVGELTVKELLRVDMLVPNVSALHCSRGWAAE